MNQAASHVSLKTPANPLGVTLAGRVAAGAAEALTLGFGPERRLTAIVVEATRNVVEHAYGDRGLGAVELSIDLQGDGGSRLDPPAPAGSVVVWVRDSGTGCPLAPTSSNPPGLGLSMISELSEELTIHSRKDGGTEIGARVRFGDAEGDSRSDAPIPQASPTASELAFGDRSFLISILPRVISAYAAGQDGTIDGVARAMQDGQAIARRLDADETPPLIAISAGKDSAGVQLLIGPLPHPGARRLLADLEHQLSDQRGARLEAEATEQASVLVNVPVH